MNAPVTLMLAAGAGAEWSELPLPATVIQATRALLPPLTGAKPSMRSPTKLVSPRGTAGGVGPPEAGATDISVSSPVWNAQILVLEPSVVPQLPLGKGLGGPGGASLVVPGERPRRQGGAGVLEDQPLILDTVRTTHDPSPRDVKMASFACSSTTSIFMGATEVLAGEEADEEMVQRRALP